MEDLVAMIKELQVYLDQAKEKAESLQALEDAEKPVDPQELEDAWNHYYRLESAMKKLKEEGVS